MALSDIKIYRAYPVIAGYVQMPLNRGLVKSGKSGVQLYATVAEVTSAIPGSDSQVLSLGSGRNTGWKAGAQEFVMLPPVSADGWYSFDPADVVIR